MQLRVWDDSSYIFINVLLFSLRNFHGLDDSMDDVRAFGLGDPVRFLIIDRNIEQRVIIREIKHLLHTIEKFSEIG